MQVRKNDYFYNRSIVQINDNYLRFYRDGFLVSCDVIAIMYFREKKQEKELHKRTIGVSKNPPVSK